MAGENGENQESKTAEETVSQAQKLGEELLENIGEHLENVKGIAVNFAEKSMDVGAALAKKAKENPGKTAAIVVGLVALGALAIKATSSKKEEES